MRYALVERGWLARTRRRLTHVPAPVQERAPPAAAATVGSWKSLVERYAYRDLLPCSEAELRSSGRWPYARTKEGPRRGL